MLNDLKIKITLYKEFIGENFTGLNGLILYS